MSDFVITESGLSSCGPSWKSDGWMTEPSHKLYFIGSGSGRYAIPGHEVALQPGRLYSIPGGRRQRYGQPAAMQVFWLHLRALSPLIERRLAGLDRIRDWPLEDWAWWRPVWTAIPAWMTARDLPGELRLQALISAVLAEVLADTVVSDPIDPRLEAALRWMDVHCLDHPPLPAAARIAGLAPAVFHRRFTAAFSCTPRAWLEARRLDHARSLLREPGASVQAGAATCGYANPFHFSRVMRRRLGVSPSQVRAQRGP
jgi:AraC-like DNA-binding protein